MWCVACGVPPVACECVCVSQHYFHFVPLPVALYTIIMINLCSSRSAFGSSTKLNLAPTSMPHRNVRHEKQVNGEDMQKEWESKIDRICRGWCSCSFVEDIPWFAFLIYLFVYLFVGVCVCGWMDGLPSVSDGTLHAVDLFNKSKSNQCGRYYWALCGRVGNWSRLIRLSLMPFCMFCAIFFQSLVLHRSQGKMKANLSICMLALCIQENRIQFDHKLSTQLKNIKWDKTHQ